MTAEPARAARGQRGAGDVPRAPLCGCGGPGAQAGAPSVARAMGRWNGGTAPTSPDASPARPAQSARGPGALRVRPDISGRRAAQRWRGRSAERARRSAAARAPGGRLGPPTPAAASAGADPPTRKRRQAGARGRGGALGLGRLANAPASLPWTGPSDGGSHSAISPDRSALARSPFRSAVGNLLVNQGDPTAGGHCPPRDWLLSRSCAEAHPARCGDDPAEAGPQYLQTSRERLAISRRHRTIAIPARRISRAGGLGFQTVLRLRPAASQGLFKCVPLLC